MNRTHFSPGLTPGCQKLLPVALMMLASTALAQPTWTDIMSTTNGTNEASGTYWEFTRQTPATQTAPMTHTLKPPVRRFLQIQR